MTSPQSLDRNATLADLLARTALADQRAFAELYRLTAPHLYGVALRILREPAQAEELLQDAFVSVWHHAGSYAAAKAKPRTWLAAIVRNRCLDQLRRRVPDTVTMTRSEDESDMDLPADGPSIDLLIAGRRPIRRAASRRWKAAEAGDRVGAFKGSRTRSWRASFGNRSGLSSRGCGAVSNG